MDIFEYHGWQACRLANHQVEVIAVTSVGPRILHFGFTGCENELYLDLEHLGKSGGEEFRAYGGHRLWHAPEASPRTYAPDNRPVRVEDTGGALRLIQPVEPATGIQKEMELRLSPEQPRVEIVHRLTNTNLWAVNLSAWAITQMTPGGTAILPLPPLRPHGPDSLLPDRSLALWQYTDPGDPRLRFHRRAVLLRQDPGMPADLKIGTQNRLGWAAYANRGRVFIKQAPLHRPDLPYPDRDSSLELYTNERFLELESLGPLRLLPPGQTLEHREVWMLAQAEWPGDAEDALPALLARIESLAQSGE